MDEEMSRQTATALPTGTSKCPPSQRVPTLSGTTASNSDLASLFECPVCFDYVLPPILQCQSGHLGEDIVFLATDINLPGAVDWVMMQSCFGFHFMLVLEKQEKYDGHQQFFAIVQLIGTRKQAENFAYRLELNGHRRRLTWEATPRSIHEGIATAIMNSDCLVFDTSIAQLFAENGNLGINVTISMC